METKIFSTKNIYFKELSDYEEKGKKVREITRENVKEIDEFKTMIKETLELRINTVECASSKSIYWRK